MQNFNNYKYGYNSYYNSPPQQIYYSIVNGFEEAKNYPVSINQSMLLMDSNQPIAYKKSVNGLGQANIECYKLVPISEQELSPKEANTEYALKSDISELNSKIDKLCEKITQLKGSDVNA